jgi:hypothetical protein
VFANELLNVGAEIAVDEMGHLLRPVERHLQKVAHEARRAIGSHQRRRDEVVDFAACPVPRLDLDRICILFLPVDDLDKLMTEAQIDHAGAPDLPKHHRLDHVLR